jgi:ferredoxin
MATDHTDTADHETPGTAYRVTIDTDACEGIFACLTRDPRFVEADDGLATIDPGADPVPPEGSDDGRIREEEGRVVAEFDDDRIEEARTAAEACPPGAISVERVAPQGTEEVS